MRVSLSPETVESLEDLTGKKITRNGDQVVQEVCDMAESEQSNNEEISEIKEPKVIVEEVPQDNSNKPVVHFTQFNGKLLPFAKRHNI